ncbi:hypothetical protein FHX08_002049 [Rhizobium sp. BK529]|uniref:hypothetical protein n=1 Tax=Rhizobium sp. BK529 TaxID=2586983 RepID=UPI001621F8CE|nr:hypothetical protein [Rhizobium sp. BK529]MBB3591705.1 hypothetical protein [Rhizobium sp. BK529]
MSDAIHNRLKAAQRDLIDEVGGIERAAKISEYAKSTVGRWRNPRDPELMPMMAVIRLEGDCGRAFVTEVMAGANGRDLSDNIPADAAIVSDLLSAHADVTMRFAELGQVTARAFSDGVVTPAEADEMDRKAAEVDDAVEEERRVLASVKAKGGAAAALKIVGGK